MSRTALIILALIVVAGGAFFLTRPAPEPEVEAGVESATEAVEEAADDAAEASEEAQDAASDAVDAAEDAADAAEDAVDAAEDAVDAVTDAAEDAVDSATDAAEDAADAAADAAEDAVDEASDLLNGAVDALTGGADLPALLDPASFDADALIEAVEGANLGDEVTQTLTTAIEGARDNPDQVEAVIAQVREALGL